MAKRSSALREPSRTATPEEVAEDRRRALGAADKPVTRRHFDATMDDLLAAARNLNNRVAALEALLGTSPDGRS